jgi:hypothetical protein
MTETNIVVFSVAETPASAGLRRPDGWNSKCFER